MQIPKPAEIPRGIHSSSGNFRAGRFRATCSPRNHRIEIVQRSSDRRNDDDLTRLDGNRSAASKSRAAEGTPTDGILRDSRTVSRVRDVIASIHITGECSRRRARRQYVTGLAPTLIYPPPLLSRKIMVSNINKSDGSFNRECFRRALRADE